MLWHALEIWNAIDICHEWIPKIWHAHQFRTLKANKFDSSTIRRWFSNFGIMECHYIEFHEFLVYKMQCFSRFVYVWQFFYTSLEASHDIQGAKWKHVRFRLIANSNRNLFLLRMSPFFGSVHIYSPKFIFEIEIDARNVSTSVIQCLCCDTMNLIFASMFWHVRYLLFKLYIIDEQNVCNHMFALDGIKPVSSFYIECWTLSLIRWRVVFWDELGLSMLP